MPNPSLLSDDESKFDDFVNDNVQPAASGFFKRSSNALSSVYESVKNNTVRAYEAAKYGVTSAASFVGGIFGKIGSVISNASQSVFQSVISMPGKIWGFFRSAPAAVVEDQADVVAAPVAPAPAPAVVESSAGENFKKVVAKKHSKLAVAEGQSDSPAPAAEAKEGLRRNSIVAQSQQQQQDQDQDQNQNSPAQP